MAKFAFILFMLVAVQATAEPPLLNVSYKSVTEYPYREADNTQFYGENPLQWAKYWAAKPNAQQAKGVLIFVHGGCWLNAFDAQHSYPLASALADQGYAVWSIEYRRTGDEGGGWPGSLNDVQAAVDFIVDRSVEGAEHNNFILLGHSAGGHLALLAGQTQPKINKIFALAGISDIKTYSKGSNSCEKATVQFIGGDMEANPAAYEEATPDWTKLVQRAHLLHGEKDSIVAVDQSVNSPASYTTVAGAGHFDWIHPGSFAFQVLMHTLAKETVQE